MRILVFIVLLVGVLATNRQHARRSQPARINHGSKRQFSSVILDQINSGNNLETVHVVFRHGDRTPERLYPNDPYTAADFFPIGIGQLTNNGRSRAYRLGLALREKYNTFLGNQYYPDIVDALSSHSPRCKNSLLALLAGLFPPQGDEVWNSTLPWQPIPFNTFTSAENRIFAPFGSCAAYTNLVGQSMEGIYTDPDLAAYSDNVTYNYLLTNSGMTGNPGYAVDLLFSTLKSEDELGLTLPSWTTSVWPEPITTMEGHVFKYLANTDDLKKIAAGYLAARIMSNIRATIQNNSQGKKIFLYSGHDANLVSLLMMMDNFKPHCPPYSAYITFEVHNLSGTRYLKIVYNDYSTSGPKVISLPNCGKICTVDQFQTKYGKYMNTTEADALCGSW